jgi:hypothetical protein
MKLMVRLFLTIVICLTVMPTAFGRNPRPRSAVGSAAGPAVSVTGVFENITVGKGSGDLEGMRVSILSAGGGYYAIVQIAEGGAEDPKPEFVAATVKGSNVSFAVGDRKFSGMVTAAGLRIKESGGTPQVLKRKPCSTLF